ncbi:MAG: hypothetical protein ABI707_10560 [Ferruginibacter sp.]
MPVTEKNNSFSRLHTFIQKVKHGNDQSTSHFPGIKIVIFLETRVNTLSATNARISTNKYNLKKKDPC